MSVETSETKLDRVRRLVAIQMGVAVDDVKPESDFRNNLGADSLDTIELAMDIEDDFNLEIPDEAIEKFRTVQDVVTYLESRVK